jgi:2'-hydroxyisoflavone reductase
MKESRRGFLKLSGGAVSALVLGPSSLASAAQDWQKPQNVTHADKSLKVLFLGGTRFLGPHQVEYALARGHRVTLFNRGKTNPHLFPDVEKLRGDRNDDLKALENRSWDAVIDNSAHIPRWISDVGQVLRGRVGQFLFISSTGVYHPYKTVDIPEEGQLATLEDPSVEEVNGETFGGLKVLCEKESEKQFPGMATVVRPHLIVGPGDNTDRFTYWPARIARGGEVLAPGNSDDPIQIIDVRDLSRFCVQCLEEGHTGVFNAVGPRSPMTISGLLHGIRATVSNEIRFTWVDADFLEKNGVQAWGHMPAWIPPQGEYLGMCLISGRKALEHGMVIRPLAVTATDTLSWWESLDEERRSKPRAGCPADLEAKTLEAWHKAKSG